MKKLIISILACSLLCACSTTECNYVNETIQCDYTSEYITSLNDELSALKEASNSYYDLKVIGVHGYKDEVGNATIDSSDGSVVVPAGENFIPIFSGLDDYKYTALSVDGDGLTVVMLDDGSLMFSAESTGVYSVTFVGENDYYKGKGTLVISVQ